MNVPLLFRCGWCLVVVSSPLLLCSSCFALLHIGSSGSHPRRFFSLSGVSKRQMRHGFVGCSSWSQLRQQQQEENDDDYGTAKEDTSMEGGSISYQFFMEQEEEEEVAFSFWDEKSNDDNLMGGSILPVEEEDALSLLLLENGNAKILDVTIDPPHRPLGCIVEESLPTGQYLFVSRVTPGSRAEEAGLRVGDVLLACRSLFGSGSSDTTTSDTAAGPPQPALTSLVLGFSEDTSSSSLSPVVSSSSSGQQQLLDTFLGLVQACPDSEPLTLRIARGTSVLELHEQALVELCANTNGGGYADVEQCLLDYLEQSYRFPTSLTFDASDEKNDKSPANNNNNNDEETGGLLDNVFDLWNQEYLESVAPPPPLPSNNKPQPSSARTTQQPRPLSEVPQPPKAAVKPWSSRSSPSGTFVRDPTTGKLKNLDDDNA